MSHAVLLGDSIFDNASYVRPGEPDVVKQLRTHLPAWTASLLAVDGAVARDVHRQINMLPDDATHLVLSAGGNDALGHLDILDERNTTSAATLLRLSDATRDFEDSYRSVVERLAAAGMRNVLCMIYEGALPDPDVHRAARIALMPFNDVILRCAREFRLPLIDLRAICDRPEHYANPIEPSAFGGDRIAAAIAATLTEHDFSTAHCKLYP